MNISNLPKIIKNVANNFAKGCKNEYVSEGPINPNPGPILPNVAAERLKDEIMSMLNDEKTRAPITKIKA